MMFKKEFIIDKDNEIVKSSYNYGLNIYDDLKRLGVDWRVKSVIENLDIIYDVEPDYKNSECAATAHCHYQDKWDDRIGISIASTKSDLKYHLSMKSRYKRYIKLLTKIILKLERLMKYHDKKVENIQNYISKK